MPSFNTQFGINKHGNQRNSQASEGNPSIQCFFQPTANHVGFPELAVLCGKPNNQPPPISSEIDATNYP